MCAVVHLGGKDETAVRDRTTRKTRHRRGIDGTSAMLGVRVPAVRLPPSTELRTAIVTSLLGGLLGRYK